MRIVGAREEPQQIVARRFPARRRWGAATGLADDERVERDPACERVHLGSEDVDAVRREGRGEESKQTWAIGREQRQVGFTDRRSVQLSGKSGLARVGPQPKMPRGGLGKSGREIPLRQLPCELGCERGLLACQWCEPVGEPLPPCL